VARVPDEFDYQRAFCLWIFGNPDPKTRIPRTQPALLPNVECWHTPNGGTRTNGFEGMRLQQIGVRAGIHDLLFLRPTRFQEGTFGLLFGMEWKKPNGRPAVTQLSPAQKAMHPRLMAAGMAASCVVDNLDDARAFARLHHLCRGDV
jgi:hypothetical protein